MRFKEKVGKENGSALLMVLIVFTIVSLLGITILSVATSEHRFTNIDSKSQSAYYVAESGVNYMLSTINNEIETNFSDYSTQKQFFQAFESEFLHSDHTFDGFEENFGEKPVADINIELEKVRDNSRDYRIESSGSIGSSTRKVNSIISLNWTDPSENPIIDDLLLYTNEFEFQGNIINGANGTTVSDGIDVHDLNGGSALNISTMYFNGPVKMDGGSASFGNQINPGTIYVNDNLHLWNGTRHVYGDVRVNGNLRLKDANMHDDVYVDGDLILSWTPTIEKNIYYTGSLSIVKKNGKPVNPNDYSATLLAKCIKVDSVDSWEIPVRDIKLRDDSWYINSGYEIKSKVNNTVPDNARWFVDNYNYIDWPKWNVNNDGHFTNVVIVSKGDITINTASSFNGALIAPNGSVTLPQGGTTFNGVIISKEGINVTGGGSTVNMKRLQEVFNPQDIPVIFNIPNDDDNNDSGNSNSGGIDINVKSDIKEY